MPMPAMMPALVASMSMSFMIDGNAAPDDGKIVAVEYQHQDTPEQDKGMKAIESGLTGE